MKKEEAANVNEMLRAIGIKSRVVPEPNYVITVDKKYDNGIKETYRMVDFDDLVRLINWASPSNERKSFKEA